MVFSGVILAGGKSSRMGQDKAFLGLGGISLIEWTISVFQDFAAEIIVSKKATQFNRPGVKCVEDIYTGIGPIGGLYSALMSARYSTAFVAACDMPFFKKTVAEYFLEQKENYDAVLPVVGGKVQPLCAVYRTRCISHIERLIEMGDYRMSTLYASLNVKFVSEDILKDMVDPQIAFLNINTVDDLKYAEKILGNEQND